jgi:hypothetical protein
MKLIAMSNVLAAWIALLLVGSTEAKKAGLRQLAGRPGEGEIVNNKPQDRSLGETPECAICKDMYDTLKESTSVYACEATCDTMAEALGGGPEDRTSSDTRRAQEGRCVHVRMLVPHANFVPISCRPLLSRPALADMVMATCDPLCEIILDGSTAGESSGSACKYVGLC